MDAGSTPPILRHHATDEIAKLSVGACAAWLAGNAAPIGAIRSSVRDDGGRFDECERRGPLRPYGPQCDPEEAVSRVQSRTTTGAKVASCWRRARFSRTRVCRDRMRARQVFQTTSLRSRCIAATCDRTSPHASARTRKRFSAQRCGGRNIGEAQACRFTPSRLTAIQRVVHGSHDLRDRDLTVAIGVASNALRNVGVAKGDIH